MVLCNGKLNLDDWSNELKAKLVWRGFEKNSLFWWEIHLSGEMGQHMYDEIWLL
jgi:hypothetical protein